MRIALVIYGDLHQTTGGYLYDQRLVEYLRAAGDDVEVISLNDRGYFQNLVSRLTEPGIRTLTTEAFDAVIFDELCHSSLMPWLGTLRQQHRCVGLVHHLRHSECQGLMARTTAGLVEKQFLKSQHGLIYNSVTTQRACETLMGKSSPFVIASPGVINHVESLPDKAIAERADQQPYLRVIFVGNITRRKGLHTLLEALSFIDSPIELSVVGSQTRDIAYTQHCKTLARSSSHKIEFLGEAPAHLLVEKMRSAHVMAIPSEYEGFGMAYLEGFSAGLPAIATTEGAPAEFVTHEHNGYLVPPNSPAILADSLRSLTQNRNKLAQMGMAARAAYERHPLWADSFSSIRGFIQQLSEPQWMEPPNHSTPEMPSLRR